MRPALSRGSPTGCTCAPGQVSSAAPCWSIPGTATTRRGSPKASGPCATWTFSVVCGSTRRDSTVAWRSASPPPTAGARSRSWAIRPRRRTNSPAAASCIATTDGWSTKPQLGYSSAGGDVTWMVGLVEDNLLGTATALAAVYNNTPDRRTFDLGHVNPHFLSRRGWLQAKYSNKSDGNRGTWLVGVPFYETAARHPLGGRLAVGRERVPCGRLVERHSHEPRAPSG